MPQFRAFILRHAGIMTNRLQDQSKWKEEVWDHHSRTDLSSCGSALISRRGIDLFLATSAFCHLSLKEMSHVMT